MLLPLYPRKNPWYPLHWRLGGPHNRSGRFWRIENLLFLPGFEPRIVHFVDPGITSEWVCVCVCECVCARACVRVYMYVFVHSFKEQRTHTVASLWPNADGLDGRGKQHGELIYDMLTNFWSEKLTAGITLKIRGGDSADWIHVARIRNLGRTPVYTTRTCMLHNRRQNCD